MRGNFKRIISALTGVMLTAAVLSGGCMSVFADSQYMSKDKLYSEKDGQRIYISADKYLYRYVGNTAGVTICGYLGKDTEIVIPEALNGRVVAGIDEGIFADNDDITSVTISENILTIGEGSFCGCDSLASVTLGGGTEILQDVFNDCPSLESISIPYGVDEINSSFKNCTALKNIKFSRSVNKLGDGSFNGCTSLCGIEWSTGLTYLGDVFDNSFALDAIHIPKGIVTIDGAFDGCANAEKLELPDSLLYINSGFSGCTSLTDVELPDGLLYLGEAFGGCTSLKNVSISSETEVDESAFEGCDIVEVKKSSGVWRIAAIIVVLLLFAGCVCYTLYRSDWRPFGREMPRDSAYDENE